MKVNATIYKHRKPHHKTVWRAFITMHTGFWVFKKHTNIDMVASYTSEKDAVSYIKFKFPQAKIEIKKSEK